MTRKMLFTFFATALISLNLSAQTKPELTVKKIMQGPKYVGNLPGQPWWSEDGKTIYFNWNPENADSDSLYRVDPKAGTPEKVSLADQKNMPSRFGVYTRDYRRKVYTQNGDIFLYDVRRGELKQLTKTSSRESNVTFTQDESGLIFRNGNSLFQWDLASGAITEVIEFKSGKKPPEKPGKKSDIEEFLKHEELQLISILKERKDKRDTSSEARKALEDNVPVAYIGKDRVQNIQLSPDGRYVSVSLREQQQNLRTIVPNYVDESGYTKDLNARPKVGSPQAGSKFGFYDLEKDTLVFVKTDNLPEISAMREFTTAPSKKDNKKKAENGKAKPRDASVFGPYWSSDGANCYFEIRTLDHKDRWLAFADFETGELTAFERQYDEAWIGGPNISSWGFAGQSGWLPDNQTIWFCSEETGYSHLYAYNVETKEKTALTSGDFEIYNPTISRDKKSWHFGANNVHPGERHFYRMPLNGGDWTKLTSLPGSNSVALSPDGKKMAIRYSYINKPWEIYVQDAKSGAQPKQLTESTTEDWRKYPWRTPEIVRFDAEDGAKPYARLYRPENPNGAGVVFVHGAGYLQNAHKWWSSYYREFMFHNLLADKGYTVLDIDYRASAGYGRDWRTGIYRFMGGKDLDDQVDGAKYLVEKLGVDKDRIGIYGGSYGGFITLMAMFTKPGVFKSGAALRSVTDWAHYNHPYTSNILNIPQADTLAYRKSSPIYHAEGLEGHLLILHGMIDRNVHFQDVVRLAQRLIELEKENWEFAVYPLEGHGFVEPSSWTDEYRRILKLFEDTLQE